MLFFANTLFRICGVPTRYTVLRPTLVKVHPTVCSISWCLEIPGSIGKLNQGLELASSAVMQSLILVADFLLVVRCYVMFSDKIWVWTLAAFPLRFVCGQYNCGDRGNYKRPQLLRWMRDVLQLPLPPRRLP
ncbi:hypothetical protein FA13DRAFT_1287269 [Coprinellus micaceus]|uniref:Uncharacterized protein n=1 Tax=Coprinellus micaceus TaxID=71717 RepID=A0A4Y7SSG3_COPMI|nr:hypothetical protein FA13DRAFT_1287269 [Coprinellus micaceus]